MILAFSDTCPLFDPGNELQLHRLLLTVFRRWHVVAQPHPERLREIMPRHVWRLYGELIIQNYKSAINSRQSWVNCPDCSSCDPERIADYFSLPTLILVENAASDGSFLRLVVTRLRPSRARDFVGANPRLEIRHGGGITEIPKEIERLGGPYSAARPSPAMPPRFVILADSDAHLPGRLSQAAQAVVAAAKNIGVAVHILSKRTIENYIPDAALHDYAKVRKSQAAAVALVIGLQPPARDHYPMKDGLSAVESVEAGGLYPAGITLSQGLGNFMVDLLTNFGHTVRADDLRRRDGTNELDQVLDLLEENL